MSVSLGVLLGVSLTAHKPFISEGFGVSLGVLLGVLLIVIIILLQDIRMDLFPILFLF